MTEQKMKGLFGGGEATGGNSGQGAQTPSREERRAARAGRRAEGGGGGGGRRRRQLTPEEAAQAQDFINRYTTGHPAEGFSSDEAIGYLRQLHGQAPPDVMQRAAVQTVQNLPEDQRQAFAEMLRRRQAGTGMVTIERTGQAREAQGRGGGQGDAGMDDLLGSLFGGMLGGGMAQPAPQPQGAPGGFDDVLGGLLGGLLGGGAAQTSGGRRRNVPASDPFGDILGGMMGGGTAAPEPQRQQQSPQEQGGGIGDILGSPLGKAVLGGIAAFAMKEMMDKSRKR